MYPFIHQGKINTIGVIIMAGKSLSSKTFYERLNQWVGQNIKIFKEEIGDDDETLMALESITHVNHTVSGDDYIPAHTLQLNGSGAVENEDDQLEPLPKSEYEIPIEDSTTFQFDGDKFKLKTERGIYTIERT